MRITNKQISKAIEERTGLADVYFYLERSKAYGHFYSDTNHLASYLLSNSPCEATIQASALSDYSIEEWVDEFKYIIDGALSESGESLHDLIENQSNQET